MYICINILFLLHLNSIFIIVMTVVFPPGVSGNIFSYGVAPIHALKKWQKKYPQRNAGGIIVNVWIPINVQ
jgi:hypothetical protein